MAIWQFGEVFALENLEAPPVAFFLQVTQPPDHIHSKAQYYLLLCTTGQVSHLQKVPSSTFCCEGHWEKMSLHSLQASLQLGPRRGTPGALVPY